MSGQNLASMLIAEFSMLVVARVLTHAGWQQDIAVLLLD
jgi:hypothetical protein